MQKKLYLNLFDHNSANRDFKAHFHHHKTTDFLTNEKCGKIALDNLRLWVYKFLEQTILPGWGSLFKFEMVYNFVGWYAPEPVLPDVCFNCK